MPSLVPDDVAGQKLASFGSRIGAQLIDMALGIVCTVAFSVIAGKPLGEASTRGSTLAFLVWVSLVVVAIHVVCVAVYGASPGKMAMRIRIMRLDGAQVGWREAGLRYSVDLLLQLTWCSGVATALVHLSDAEYAAIAKANWSWRQFTAFAGAMSVYAEAAQPIWRWSEFLVMLTNRHRRAVQDFIAGTVVVRVPSAPAVEKER